MLVYLGLLAVLLITSEVKYINEISKANHIDTFKDLNNNDIHVNSYCAERICVLQCCFSDQDINSDGACDDVYYIKEFNHLTNDFINMTKWNHEAQEAKVLNTIIYENFAFIQNKLSDEYTDEFQMVDARIFDDGYLQILVNRTATKWLEAEPLHFCVNNHLSAVLQEQTQISIIVKHTTENKNNADSEIYKYIAGGMLMSLISMGFIVYRMSPTLKKMIGMTIIAFTLSLATAYILIAVQLLALRAGMINSTECRIMSPFLYFFLLSSFFWVNILSYDTWSMIRNFRKYSTKINKEVDPAKCIRFAVYGWATPFLITVVAEVVDILKLDLILPIARPPFESCLADDTPMMVYTQIPISILIATNCILYLMNIYNVWSLLHFYQNVVDISAILIRKRRFVPFKILAIIGVSAALEWVPNVPFAIYVSIHANNILVATALCSLFICEMCSCNESPTRYKVREKLKDIYRNFTGTYTKRSTISTIFMNDKNKDDLREINAMISEDGAREAENMRY